MHGNPPRRRRLTGGIAAALAAAALGPLAAGAPAPAGALPGDEEATPLETPTESRARVVREQLVRTSARLAQTRSAADAVGGAERAALRSVEQRLSAEKEELRRRLAELSEQAVAERAEIAAAEAADDAEVAAGAAAAGAGVRVFVPPTPAPVVGSVDPASLTGDSATVAFLDAYLASKASPLTGLGANFVAESAAVGLDPRFLVAVAGAETSFGAYGPSQIILNPFGLGPGLRYPSWAHAIHAAAQNLGGPIYAGEGRYTIPAIQQRWAPHGAANDPTGLNSNWTRNVSTYYAELGGNPLGAVFALTVPSA
jgi:hypothetical protein